MSRRRWSSASASTASILPALTLTLAIVAHMMRMTRAAIINLLASPYIEMARLKGVSPAQHHPASRAAECLGADRHGRRLQPRLPDRRRRRGRAGVHLSRHRPADGRWRDLARYSGGAGLRADFRGNLHPAQPHRRRHHHRHQSAPAEAAMSDASADSDRRAAAAATEGPAHPLGRALARLLAVGAVLGLVRHDRDRRST